MGESEGVRVSSVRADYSHVRSRIDTGRQRTKTAEVCSSNVFCIIHSELCV